MVLYTITMMQHKLPDLNQSIRRTSQYLN